MRSAGRADVGLPAISGSSGREASADGSRMGLLS
jgi:hypothetical protein